MDDEVRAYAIAERCTRSEAARRLLDAGLHREYERKARSVR
jgi:hypothetical protein